MKHTLQLLFFLAISFAAKAQYTLITDPNFEQALITLDIDSDGVVDGQVLTNDIENVTELILLDNYHITDLTGIQDFFALEVLNLHHNLDLTSLDVSNNLALRILDVSQNLLTELDLSNNVLLEELYCGNPTDDVWPQNEIVQIDLTHNPNIHILWAENMFSLLDGGINLANGNNETAMHINVMRSGMDWTDDTPICIQVDDVQAAINGESPYSDWTVIGGHFYSEKVCALSISAFERKEISIYPNPVSDILYFDAKDSEIEKVILYDITGRKVLEQIEVKAVSVSHLRKGTYLLKIVNEQGIQTKKIIIK